MPLVFQIAAGVLLAAVVIFIVWFYLEYLGQKERSREEERFYAEQRRAREREDRERENRTALEEERKAAWLAYYHNPKTPEWEVDLARETGGIFGKEIQIPLDGSWPPNDAERKQNPT